MQVLNIQKEVKSPRVKSVCFHRNKPILLLALHNGEINAYDYTLSAFVHKFLDHDGPVRSIHFHSRNDIFVSGGDDLFVRIWDYASKTSTKLKGHTDYIRCVRFHSDEPYVLSASDDRTIKIWNFQSKKKLKTLAGHTNYVMCAEFLGNRVISASLDQTIRIWDINSGTSEIIEAHDKGINALSVLPSFSSFLIFSGSDDKTIKAFNSDLINTDTINCHRKAVTALLSFEKTVISCGEDGLLFVNENKKTRRIEKEGRFWCLARSNDNMIAAGHDGSFILFKLKNDIVYNDHFILKDNKIVNYRNEKVLEFKKEVKTFSTHNDMLIVNYAHRFEVFKIKDRKLQWSETGNAVFFNDVLIVSNRGEYHTYNYNGKVKDECLFILNGRCKGFSDVFFVFNDKKLVMIDKKYERKTATLPFNVRDVCYSNADGIRTVVVIGTNDLVLLNEDMAVERHVNEVIKILSAVISDDVVFYSTEKQLKYIMGETMGVICSISSLHIVKMYKKGDQDVCLLINDDKIIEREVNLDEIKFKKAVIENNTEMISSYIGNLPGMVVVDFLKNSGRGDIALPYIKERKEKFKLYVSMKDIKNAYDLAKDVKEYETVFRLGMNDMDILTSNYDTVENALKKMKNMKMLFLFYLVTKNEGKLCKTKFNDSDVELLKCIYADSRDGVKRILTENRDNEDDYVDDEDSADFDVSDPRSEEEHYYGYENEEVNKMYDTAKLDEKKELLQDHLVYEDEFEKAMSLIDQGKIKESLKMLYTILYSLRDLLSEEQRGLLGRYIAGLESERKRKKEKDQKGVIERATFFYNLDLLERHRNIQTENYVAVSYKNGNYKNAKQASEGLDGEMYAKVRKSKYDGNKIEIGSGVFCNDTGYYSEEGRLCQFCGSYNKGSSCAVCYIGVIDGKM